MSEALTARHALTAFLALPETPTGGDASIVVEIRPNCQYLNLRGDAGDAAFTDAIRAATGTGLPIEPNTSSGSDHTIYWMGPNEWLVRSDRIDEAMVDDIGKRLANVRASVVDVTEGYVMLSVDGLRAREVLAKGCALDLRSRSFSRGQCAQTAISRTSTLIVAGNADGCFELIVRRTFAEYLALWLRNAAAEFGVRFQLRQGKH